MKNLSLVIIFSLIACSTAPAPEPVPLPEPVPKPQAKSPEPYKIRGMDFKQEVDPVMNWIIETLQCEVTIQGWDLTIAGEYIQVVDEEGNVEYLDTFVDKPEKHIYIFPYQDCFADTKVVSALWVACGLNFTRRESIIESFLLKQTATATFCKPDYEPRDPPGFDQPIDIVFE